MGKNKQVKNDRTLWNGLPGVYAIRNLRSRRIYVGWSTCLVSRWNAHVSQLKSGRHPVRDMQLDFNKQNGQEFRFTVLVPHVDGLGYEHKIVNEQLKRELDTTIPDNWHEAFIMNSLPPSILYNQFTPHRGTPAFMRVCQKSGMYQDEIATISRFCKGSDSEKFFYDQRLIRKPLQANGLDCFQEDFSLFLRNPEYEVLKAVLIEEGISFSDLAYRLLMEYAEKVGPEVTRRANLKKAGIRQLYTRYEEECKITKAERQRKQQEEADFIKMLTGQPVSSTQSSDHGDEWVPDWEKRRKKAEKLKAELDHLFEVAISK